MKYKNSKEYVEDIERRYPSLFEPHNADILRALIGAAYLDGKMDGRDALGERIEKIRHES